MERELRATTILQQRLSEYSDVFNNLHTAFSTSRPTEHHKCTKVGRVFCIYFYGVRVPNFCSHNPTRAFFRYFQGEVVAHIQCVASGFVSVSLILIRLFISPLRYRLTTPTIKYVTVGYECLRSNG